MIQIGRPAPSFTLLDQDDRKVSLADFAGRWVVLYFYPRDDTPGCTTEACDFAAGLRAFDKLDATVLGCSPDSTESHRSFRKKHGLKIDLLSDPTHRVMQKYSAWGEKMLYGKKSVGVIRSTVLIGPHGRVAHHWPRARAKGHADAVRAKLEVLTQA